MTTQTADEHAIHQLVHRYADAASRRDPAGVASTFTVDGEWQAPELGRFTGRDAMVAFFTSMLGGWNMFLQGLQSGVVVVDATNPDRATGRWFVQETGQRAEGTNLIICRRVPRRVRPRRRLMADRAPPLRSAAAQRRRYGDRVAVPDRRTCDRVLGLDRDGEQPLGRGVRIGTTVGDQLRQAVQVGMAA